MPTIVGPRCNRRVTCDASPSNARSESALAINPLDPYHMVGASKRFTNPSIYAFSLAAYASFDGGLSWTESPPLFLPAGWAGTSDPAVAWDDAGNAYLVALPFGPGSATDFTGSILGIAVYKSSDGGRTWGTPTLIHASPGDDKQWAAGDVSPTSPYFGHVYAAWDDGAQLRFARTTDHGATWIGTGASAAGSVLATDSFSPEISVAADGTIYIVYLNGQSGSQIKYVKSTDGGNTFTPAQAAATGITSIRGSFPETGGFPHFPGATFRVLTLATGCTGAGGTVVFAWADGREIIGGQRRSRIYYRRSTNGGNTWLGPASGQPLLTGALASPADKQDFHPQIIATPNGEIGCAFYEFGPTGSGEFPPNLIHVILAVSTNNGSSFSEKAFVTEKAWDPAVDAPFSHGNPSVTFIGEYFGFDASRLGFFPLWTDTRTGVQELFAARLAVNPADVYIRDSSSDAGDVPSPGFHWEAPDLIVRRQPDGDTTFVNEDLLPDGVTNHYVYAKVINKGPNTARNVRLAVTVGNWPVLAGLPGTEFRYPQDWYPKDWNTPALQASRLWLDQSAAMDIPADNAPHIIGPVLWPAAQIPPPGSWHPCLLAEMRADNDDSGGGLYGCGVDADPDPCVYGAYFWGHNNVCQRNLAYATVPLTAAADIDFPFLVGSVWSKAKFMEIIVDKGRELARIPMTLHLEPICPPGEEPKPPCPPGELVFVERGRVIVRAGDCEVGEIIAEPGTVWRPKCPKPPRPPAEGICHGGEQSGREWKLTQPKATVGIPVAAGDMLRARLAFTVPPILKPGTRTLVRIFQRNDAKVITGSVVLEVRAAEAADAKKTAPATRVAAKAAATRAGKRRKR